MAGRLGSAAKLGLTGAFLGAANYMTDGEVLDRYQGAVQHFKENGFTADSFKKFFYDSDGSFDWAHASMAVASPLLAWSVLSNGLGIIKGGKSDTAEEDAKNGMGWGTKLALAAGLLAAGTTAAYALNNDVKDTVDGYVDDAKNTVSQKTESASNYTNSLYNNYLGDGENLEGLRAPSFHKDKTASVSSVMGSLAGGADNLSTTPQTTPATITQPHQDSLGFNNEAYALNRLDGNKVTSPATKTGMPSNDAEYYAALDDMS